MTDKERDTISVAVGAMTSAIELWPDRHPADGVIKGAQKASDLAYARMLVSRDNLFVLLSVEGGE
jgi:hypothetical protein